jgi:hypothetical protein
MVMMMGLLLLAAPIFANNVIRQTDHPAGPMGFKLKIWILLEFGKRSLDCTGFGFCRFDMGLEKAINKANLSVNQAYGEGYFEDDGHFVIEFPKDNMRNETVTTYFNNKFIVEEDFEIPHEMLGRLKYSGNYKIKTGEYRITEKEGRLIVKF